MGSTVVFIYTYMKTDIAYIYGLVDPRDNRIRYIGKTISPKKRLYSHIYETKIFSHRKSNWVKSLLNMGLKPTMVILKVCPLSEFEKYETEYIKLYKDNDLTNSDESGQGNKGRKRDIIEGAAKKMSKTVYQFDLSGNFIGEFKSVREASRVLKLNHAYIVRCCNGEFKHTNQFIFRYDRNSEIEKIEIPNAVKKSVVELDSDGIVIAEWKSIMDCSRETGIDNGNLSRVCNNILRKVSGRIFKFKVD